MTHHAYACEACMTLGIHGGHRRVRSVQDWRPQEISL